MARTSKCLISLVLLVNLFSLYYFPQQIGEENALFNPSPPLQEKPMSEEENIDSLDVNPKSGRWNVSTDDTTDDLITDSQLRLITTNNETSGSSEFDMNRGMRKSDGKVEWRSMANGGGNQTSYARDQLGDDWDFETDSNNWGVSSGSTVSQSEGLLSVIRSASDSTWGIVQTFTNEIPTDVYNSFEIKIKGTGSIQTNNRLRWTYADTSFQESVFQAGSLSAEWQTFEIDLSADSNWAGTTTVKYLEVLHATTSDGGVQIEYINLIGDLDFATHVESEVEDTWDWEDSHDFFYTEENNVSDFDDGTTEGYTGASGSSVAVNSSGYLTITSGGVTQGAEITGLSIDSSIYKWLTIEIFPETVDISQINILDSVNNDVCIDATTLTAGEWSLFSCNLDDDADWAGTETELDIRFTSASENIINVNFTFLYDVELGDLEGWADLNLDYVNPEGHLTATLEAGAFELVNSPSLLTIDTSLFEIYQVRIKASSDIVVFPYGRDSANNLDQLGSSQAITDRNWNTFTWDLSEDSDWSGDSSFQRMLLLFDESDGTLDGNEIIQIGYVLLKGHWEEPDSVIGLSNPETYEPVLNITTHFWENTSLGGRYEIELLDQSGELAYYYYSDNFTNLGSEWVRGKLEYNVLKSILKITITWDNTSRVFRQVFPGGFTVGSGRIPALFEIGIAPTIFVSTYTEPTSWQQLNLDFIKAPFKERDWVQTTAPSDPDWVQDSHFFAMLQNNVSGLEKSEWDLNVIGLDSVSAVLKIDQSNYTTWDASAQVSAIFELYGVDADDGERQILTSIQLTLGSSGPTLLLSVDDGTDSFFLFSESSLTNPMVRFSISTVDDRSKILVNIRAFKDDADETDFKDGAYVIDLADRMDVPSNEFIIRSKYLAVFLRGATDVDKLLMETLDFGLVERDIFGDIANAVVAPIGNFLADLFIGVFRFIGDIFRIVGDAIGFVFSVAISALQVALEAAISLVTAAVVALQTALETAIGLVTAAVEAIGTLIDSAISALGTLLETAIDLVTDAIDAVFGLIGDVLDTIGDIFDLIVSFIPDLLTAIVSWVEDELIPGVISFMFEIWDLVWTPILNLVGLKSFVDGIVQQDFGTYVSDFITFFIEIANILKWVLLLVVFFMVSLPIFQAKSNGRMDGAKAFSGILDNSFRSGFHTPDTSIFNFSLGRIFIPTIIIVYIAMKILIAAGTLPDFFGGLPI